MPVTVAIVGAGPSGFYAAEALLKSDVDCRIDIVERLPAPYGLVRYGVAPDHEKTKGVTRAFERTAQNEKVSYYGNVELGRDLSLDELRGLYDAVVIATGAPRDRPLAIPGAEKPGVLGAAAFVGWYNGHPDFRDLDPELDTRSVAIIGNGNVALDVARVLAKTPEELATSDLPCYAAEAFRKAAITELHLLGRRGPIEAKWTNVELREMGRLADCLPVVDPAQLPEGITNGLSERDRRLREKNLATLRGFLALEAGARRKRLHFAFCAKPLEVLGGARVEGLRVERTRVEEGRAVGTGETFDLPCGLIISSIGHRVEPLDGLACDHERGILANRKGRVAKGLYVVGWAKRGATGVIASNKPDGDSLARQIAKDIRQGSKPGGPMLEQLLAERGRRWIGFDDWKRIEAAEVAAAPPGAPRRKLIGVDDMLAIVGSRANQGRGRSG